ncbi:MAG: hypothetical protein ABH859_05075 [Pseudomonadota bacterium]
MQKILHSLVIAIILFPAIGLSGDFEGTKAWNKVDPNLQAAWQAAQKNGDMEEKFSCIVRVEAPMDDGDLNFLTSAGFIVQMPAGNSARGQVKAKNLENVANLPFVQKIILSSQKVQ